MKSPADIRLQPLLREREWHWEEIPVLKLTLSLPHCESEDRRIRRINRYYESFAGSAEQYALRFLFPAARDCFREAVAANVCPSPWCFSVDFSTQLLSKTIWSLTIETAEQTDLGIYRCRYSDNWDLQSAYHLSLADCFPKDPLYRRRLRQAAGETLRQQQLQGVRLHDNWRRLVSAWNREHFYLTDEGLHWYYPMYAFGGEQMGIPGFFLPWNGEEGPCLPLDKGCHEDIS